MVKGRVCFVVSSPMTARVFLSGHLLALSRHYCVDLVCNAEGNFALDKLPDVRVIPVAIQRKVALVADLLALFKLYRHFRAGQYNLICSVTPKAGLLSLLAAFLSRVPVRIHIFTGQVWVTRSGGKRWFLKTVDKLMAWLATDLLADSPSQRQFLIAEGIASAGKIQVLAAGSICGVDVERFKPRSELRQRVRRELGVPEDAIVVLFLGRVNRDKGVTDLAQAYAELGAKHQNLWMLVVGPDEDNMRQHVEAMCTAVNQRLRFIGFTDQPERFIMAADIFALPSYREGFGSSVIEAAASGIPTVCSKVYGLTDAVIDGVTGLLHTPADVSDICHKIEMLIIDPCLRRRLAEAARSRAISEFSQQRLISEMRSFLELRLHQ